jgi:hypothetical protein
MDIELLSIGNKMLEPMLFRVPPKAGSDGRTRMWAKNSSTC